MDLIISSHAFLFKPAYFVSEYSYILQQLLHHEFSTFLIISWFRHPRITLLMAVCIDPRPENTCLVLEHFELGSLNHLLYQTQIDMGLHERVRCLLDVTEGMTYLNNHSIVHGFLNSYSVLIHENFRAKVGSLEYSQENGKQIYNSSYSVHENWMAPEQLLREPPTMAGDVYRSVLVRFISIIVKYYTIFIPFKYFFLKHFS